MRDLPTHDSAIDQSSPRFDELQGGKIGPGKWRRWESGFGTTCGTTLVGWLLDAGAPPELINADPPGGSGFKIGDHIARLDRGAKSLGWWKTPLRSALPDLRPGDIFQLNHQVSGGDGTHVGVVLSATPSEDGSKLTVETADGGQGSRDDQKITRNTRTFSLSDGPNPVVVQSPSGPSWLVGVVHVGGDDADPAADGAGGSSGDDAPSDEPPAVPVAAKVVAAGLVLVGVAFVARSLLDLGGGPPRMAAVTSSRHVERRLREYALRA